MITGVNWSAACRGRPSRENVNSINASNHPFLRMMRSAFWLKAPLTASASTVNRAWWRLLWRAHRAPRIELGRRVREFGLSAFAVGVHVRCVTYFAYDGRDLLTIRDHVLGRDALRDDVGQLVFVRGRLLLEDPPAVLVDIKVILGVSAFGRTRFPGRIVESHRIGNAALRRTRVVTFPLVHVRVIEIGTYWIIFRRITCELRLIAATAQRRRPHGVGGILDNVEE